MPIADRLLNNNSFNKFIFDYNKHLQILNRLTEKKNKIIEDFTMQF
jgi:hypothetical protein